MRLWVQIVLVILTTAAIGTWSLVFDTTPDGVLDVYVLDVGQGDSIYIRTPSGNDMIIDGGPGSRVMRELSSVMPRTDRSIDVMLVTHPHYDHMAGLVPVLEEYDVDFVVEGGGVSDEEVYKNFIAAIGDTERRVLDAGDIVHIDEGVTFEVYLSTEEEDDSIVGKLIYGDTSLFLTGDAEKIHEARLLRSGVDLASDVLKVPHHGSKYSSTKAFIKAVNPWLAVIPVGKNYYDHPHEETLKRYEGIEVMRTDEEGTIHIRSDGERFSVVR